LIRVGTRGSALALAQARLVADLLEEEAELVPIKTSGDRGPGGDKARFVKQIEDALLAGEVDLAVHSAKDVPSELPEGLAIVGVPERADPRDAVCGVAGLSELAEGAAVGTSSLRRRAQLLALRPDLEVRDLRGNVDTRLGRLEEGDFDALVLAAAGLERLGRGDAGTPVPELTPAPGQGCLALEARTDDAAATEAAEAVTHRDSLVRLTAERALVAALDASCRTPLGAHAELDGNRLALIAFVGLPDGSVWVRDRLEGDRDDPVALGKEVAGRVLGAGGGDVLEQAERQAV
jgi:hydroxymethylbilane synthase